MDQKDWILIKTLHEEKNITRTAERLYVSQPSLSYRLKNLEEEFGVTLFFKTKKGIEFTSEGEHLVRYAEDMWKQLQETKDSMRNMSETVTGTLRLGVSSNFAQHKLPKILKQFSLHYPNVQFSVNTGWSTQVMNLLDSSRVHVGILRGNYPWNGEKSLLTKERLCLISKKEIAIDDLPNLPYINYKTDTSLKDLIQDWWHDKFSEPPFVAMEVDRQETAKEMVKNDLGFAILPEICLHSSDNLYTYGLSYRDESPLLRNTWLMYDPSYLNLSVVKAFIDFLKLSEK
ncbi:LysR family transcriptional regulator [Priestia aryabhattai]|uniref:LysR family transcriptional regulator n=1 Tax=Priestia aryabhattai TaxID=412384 RepID=UPI0015F4AD44|nr:LysR family transcriptional regulator [Priestia aryabhattai]MBU3573139.1 LysR family transcriptional regulator [Priestia aryabhattai]WDL86108.1 LysR family transcriptional regulator [Priestia aryabhattai]